MSAAGDLVLDVRKRLSDTLVVLDQLVGLLPKEAPEEVAAPPTAPGLVAQGLQKHQQFYDYIRGDAGELFPKMLQSQLDGVEQLLKQGSGVLPLSWMAYVLATVYHETNQKMQPVREAYWLSEEWRQAHLAKYYPYYGRGDIQLTWKDNYRKVGELLSLDLVDQPDLALRPDISAKIAVLGCANGWFTGKKLRDFIPEHPTRDNYKNARQVVNLLDKADLIAGYAIEFENGLRLGDWR